MGRKRTYCRWCRRAFLFDPHPTRPDPKICGRIHCHAREHWTAEEWDGRARMARARRAAARRLVRAGRDRDGNVVPGWSTTEVLDDLDREALARAR
jgi:hypothetical protein